MYVWSKSPYFAHPGIMRKVQHELTANISPMADTYMIAIIINIFIPTIVSFIYWCGLVYTSNKLHDWTTYDNVNKLSQEEFIGGGDISNILMFDVTKFKAIVNPLNTAILLVVGGTRTMVLGEMVEGSKIKLLTRMVMAEQLSGNWQVMDEATTILLW